MVTKPKTKTHLTKNSARKRKPAAERKAEIVEKALQLAAELGPDRMTTELLAREVGISQAGIFRHFENKNAIWGAVAQRLGEKVKGNWNSNATVPDEIFGELKVLVASHFKTIQQTPALPAILFSRELHAENEQLRQFFTKMVASFLLKLTDVIARDFAKHRLSANISAEDVAALVISLVQGLALRWSLNSNSFNLVKEGARLLDIQLNCILAYNQENRS